MPGPLSIILINKVLLLSCLSKDTIISPSFTIFIALLIRFKKTWFIRNLSATSKIESSLHFKIKLIFLSRIWFCRSFSKSFTISTRSNSSLLRIKS
jgi:hypothetical protein